LPKKVRFFIEYFIYYLRTYAPVIILGLIFGSFLYAKRSLIIQLVSDLSYRRTDIGIEGLYSIANLPAEVSNKISYGITSLTQNEKAITSPIIEKLEVDEGNLNYTFYFKDDLYWHNGRKFRTSDLSIEIAGTTVTHKSANVLVLTLQTPFSPLLSILSQPLFYNKGLIGIGEYKVTKTTYQDGFIKTIYLTSTKDHHDQLTYHFYPNGTDLMNAFKLGEVNQITTSSLDDYATSWSKIKVNPSVSTQKYLAIFLNTNKLGSKTLRQSLAYATPKTDDNNKRTLGPIAPNSWAYNPNIKPYNYNPTRAKELLDKDHPTTIKLSVTDRELLSTAEIIKKSWLENLGITAEISIENQKPDLNEYEAILTYGIIPHDPDQYPFWHSTQTNTNITHFNNSRIDKLLEEGRLSANPVERKQIYTDFQKFLLEESPAIFLEFPTSYTISRIK
jgi:peptide/nickel transport system substrate-binding protein